MPVSAATAPEPNLVRWPYLWWAMVRLPAIPESADRNANREHDDVDDKKDWFDTGENGGKDKSLILVGEDKSRNREHGSDPVGEDQEHHGVPIHWCAVWGWSASMGTSSEL